MIYFNFSEVLLEPILKIENLRKYFIKKSIFSSKVSLVKATDDISFELKKGEIFVLAGESGSGKTVSALSILKLLPYPAASHPSGIIKA